MEKIKKLILIMLIILIPVLFLASVTGKMGKFFEGASDFFQGVSPKPKLYVEGKFELEKVDWKIYHWVQYKEGSLVVSYRVDNRPDLSITYNPLLGLFGSDKAIITLSICVYDVDNRLIDCKYPYVNTELGPGVYPFRERFVLPEDRSMVKLVVEIVDSTNNKRDKKEFYVSLL